MGHRTCDAAVRGCGVKPTGTMLLNRRRRPPPPITPLPCRFLNAWDAACLAADDRYAFISSAWQWATLIDDERQARAAQQRAGGVLTSVEAGRFPTAVAGCFPLAVAGCLRPQAGRRLLASSPSSLPPGLPPRLAPLPSPRLPGAGAGGGARPAHLCLQLLALQRLRGPAGGRGLGGLGVGGQAACVRLHAAVRLRCPAEPAASCFPSPPVSTPAAARPRPLPPRRRCLCLSRASTAWPWTATPGTSTARAVWAGMSTTSPR